MKINPNVNATQPNFQARVKKTDYMENFVRGLDKKEHSQFKEALTNLAKVAPNDVIEINQTSRRSGGSTSIGDVGEWSGTYEVKNLTNPKQTMKGVGDLTPKKMIKLINDLANPKSEEHAKVFNDNADVLDMMA